MRWDRRPKNSELKTIAEKLNAFQGTLEEVRLRLIRKDATAFRPTLDFGIEHRALQHLVLPVLYAIADLHPRQFATRGGVPAAVAQAAKAIKAGYVYAREIDITNFYGSFDGNNLVDLVPVQKKVIERVLLAEHLNIVPSVPHHILSSFGPADTDEGESVSLKKYLADARRGIPQGSAASALLAEMLLAPQLSQIPTAGRVVAYADNILVLAKSESDADAITESLGLALKKHPAGHLWPKIKSFPVGGPIDFLGHRLTVHGDEVRAEPGPENKETFERRMNARLARLRKSIVVPADRNRTVRHLKGDLSSHASNFRLCDGMKEYRQYWLAKIGAAKQEGATMPKYKSSSGKPMVFWPHADQKEIITAALETAKMQVSTEFQTVALEAICQAYMATGIAFKDWKQALAFQHSRAKDPAEFTQEALAFLKKLFPEMVLGTAIAQPPSPPTVPPPPS
jgi:Reverse transcriptase (RNA-dependent DNA polymerase)